jgi:hypothetical protein
MAALSSPPKTTAAIQVMADGRKVSADTYWIGLGGALAERTGSISFDGGTATGSAGHCRAEKARSMGRRDYSRSDHRQGSEERFQDQITAKDLFPVLTQLEALGARAVVVDIDTSGPGFREENVPALRKVVWAHRAEAMHWNHQKGRWQYQVYPALKGRETPWSGIAVLEGSGDGIVDRYPRCVETTNAVEVPTLHWAAVAAYRDEEFIKLCTEGSTSLMSGHAEVTRINRLHNRYALSALWADSSHL